MQRFIKDQSFISGRILQVRLSPLIPCHLHRDWQSHHFWRTSSFLHLQTIKITTLMFAQTKDCKCFLCFLRTGSKISYFYTDHHPNLHLQCHLVSWKYICIRSQLYLLYGSTFLLASECVVGSNLGNKKVFRHKAFRRWLYVCCTRCLLWTQSVLVIIKAEVKMRFSVSSNVYLLLSCLLPCCLNSHWTLFPMA